jgi:dienelactone hydrolase
LAFRAASTSSGTWAASNTLRRFGDIAAADHVRAGAVNVLARIGFAGAALSAFAFVGSIEVRADELVRFDGAAPRTAQGGAPGSTAPIQGYLTKPKGHGPFPAVVLLHTCLGLPATKISIADTFASWGYVALFVDDFAGRGIKETCATDFREAVSDAYGALLYLSKAPGVDPGRIAVVGYSQGADTALQIASMRAASTFTISRDLQFKVAVAFYPPCENQANVRFEIPTLVLIGASDEVTPAADCQRLARIQSSDGSDFKLVVYRGAHHGFDDHTLGAGVRLFGMWMEYNADAAEKSRSEVRRFLAANLSR